MGEAKRRRAACAQRAGQPTTVFDPASGQEAEARLVGMSYSQWDSHMRQRFGGTSTAEPSMATQHVPCNGCVACCYHPRIDVDTRLESSETLAVLDLEPDPLGDMKIRRRDDGGCVHLDAANNCSIYELRPTVCRTYDCRILAGFGVRPVHSRTDGTLVEEPRWVFDVNTREDRIIAVATAWLAETVTAAGGIPDDPDARLFFVSKMLPAAKQRVAKELDAIQNRLDRLPPEERLAFKEKLKAL